MTNVKRARHRAACRPSTPLDGFVTGRGLAAVGTTGVALTMAAMPAVAAPNANPALPQVDMTGVAEQARVALSVNPAVVVSKDVNWGSDDTVKVETVKKEAAAPAPERQASRSRAQASSDDSAQAPIPAPNGSVVSIAQRYLGVPYVWGGTTPSGFDCSGFTSYVFRQVGVSLPRTSGAQGSVGTRVSAAEAKPGDLLHWPGHVGIYIGNGMMVHAPHRGDVVKIAKVYGSPTYIRL